MEQTEEIKEPKKINFKLIIVSICVLLGIIGVIYITQYVSNIKPTIERFSQAEQKTYDKLVIEEIDVKIERQEAFKKLIERKLEYYDKYGMRTDEEILHKKKLENDLNEVEQYIDVLKKDKNGGIIPIAKADILKEYTLVYADDGSIYAVRSYLLDSKHLSEDSITKRNETAIAELTPEMQEKAKQILQKASEKGIVLLITDAKRTQEEQTYLYSLGRTREGKIVTNISDCGNSKHCAGQAIDIVQVIDGFINYNQTNWQAIKDITAELNVTWGGNWEFVDKPHIELSTLEQEEQVMLVSPVYPLYNQIDTYLKNYTRAPEEVKNTVDLWIKYGLQENIKPEVGVCIAVADTGLGDSLKTSYNIGNVGNTDGGSTQSMSSWEHGIEMLFKTFNNGKYDNLAMIGELSGNGRIALGLPGCKQATCYATSVGSSGYWNGNVISCLRKLTGDKTIDEHYEFKL